MTRHNDLLDHINTVFSQVFLETFNTRIQGGAPEPYYESGSAGTAVIYYREDFAASALHEIAHWCLAGKQRRGQDDYGYWYNPSRDNLAQEKFEAVEVKPQAIEWVFNIALGTNFRVSIDNLSLIDHDSLPFRRAVKDQVSYWLDKGLPSRARQFAQALAGDDRFLEPHHYKEIPN